MKTIRIYAGFTLWELLVTLTVVSILIGFGLPNFREFQRDNSIAAASNSLLTAILTGRSEAIKRRVPVTVCASPNPSAEHPVCNQDGIGTHGGYVVWVDDNGNRDANGIPILTDATDGNAVINADEKILLRVDEPADVINVWADSGYLMFRPGGYARTAAGAAKPWAKRILFCDDRGNRASTTGSTARVIRIDAMGRGQVLRETADVDKSVEIIESAGVATDCS